jgi:2-polyprenyl-3-methyl-5-hydroxy-6-metoxy-1,4-benzoquinol methylase
MPICQQCQSESVLHVRAKDYNLRVDETVFSYYRCTNPTCGVVFLYPIPANLGAYYPPEYDNYAKLNTIEDLLAFFAYQETVKITQLQTYKQGGRMLEIGPGYGGFAYRAKQIGFDVEVIEMSADACRFMQETLGISAEVSDDPVASLEHAGQYDVIALWHVIEHVPDPWTLLEQLPSHLLPGGIIMIAAPNPQAIHFRLFGKYWRALEAPRHLNLIPAHVIRDRLAAHGLEAVMFDSQDALAQLYDYTAWHYTFTRYLPNGVLKRVGRIVSGLTRILVKPFEQQQFGRSIYTLIFRRV